MYDMCPDKIGSGKKIERSRHNFLNHCGVFRQLMNEGPSVTWVAGKELSLSCHLMRT